jgi:hypothetical protein
VYLSEIHESRVHDHTFFNVDHIKPEKIDNTEKKIQRKSFSFIVVLFGIQKKKHNLINPSMIIHNLRIVSPTIGSQEEIYVCIKEFPIDVVEMLWKNL